MRRGIWAAGAVAMLSIALAACESRAGEPGTVAPASPPASPTPLPPGIQAPGEPRLMPPITASDVTFTHPLEQDGRTWWPAAGYGGGILFAADRNVAPTPGEPVPQAPARYDQQFWLWRPLAADWRQLWANDSTRYESVLGVDGDWELSLLYRINPGIAWILRLHNLASGEVRDIATLDPAAAGIDSMGAVMPAIGDGKVAYVHKLPHGADELVERLELYDIASQTTTTVSEAAAEGWPIVVHGSLSLAPGRLAWVHRPSDPAVAALLIDDLATGARQTIRWTPEIAWLRMTSDGAHVLGRGQLPLDATAPRDLYTLDLATGDSVPFVHTVVWGMVLVDDLASWWGSGMPGELRGYYDVLRNELHLLDAGVRASGQSGTIVSGWFFWLEGSVPANPVDPDPRVLQFVPVR